MNKKIDDSNLQLIILSFIFVLLCFILNPNFISDISFSKHWTTYHRDDIVFVYNSLLYAEGLDQHHLDHPSLFTFIIFPFFYKLAFYIGYLDFYNLSGFLQVEDINLALSKLFFISRFCIQLFSLGIIFITYKIMIKFSGRTVDSFFLTIFFIFSTGFTSASNRIDSGLIAVFFIILAFYLFLKFLENNPKKNLIYLILVFLLIFSSMMQKKLVYFIIPFLFLSSFMFLKKSKIQCYDYKFLEKISINYKYLLYLLYLLSFFFITYKTIINNTFFLDRDLDFVFLVINYIGFNLLFYLYIKNYQNAYYKNLLTYNIIFGSTYLLYKYFLIYIFSAPVAIWSISFTNFLGHLNLFSSSENIKGAFDFQSLILYAENFALNLKLVISKYFFSYSFQTILVWLNLLLFSIFFKKITSIEKKSIFSLLFGFLFVQSVILFRYEQDTYFLNSEFFLLFSLSIFFKHLKIDFKYISTLFIVLFLLLTSNYEHYLKIIKNNETSFCNQFKKDFNSTDSFYEYWTNKIPKNIRKNFCMDYFF